MRFWRSTRPRTSTVSTPRVLGARPSDARRWRRLPLTLLLLDADATVIVAHSRAPDLPRLTRDADVLCVAAGRPGLIGPEHVRPGSTVLDFGSPQGDVQTEAVAQVAGSITPVPGGTGPMTVAVLAEQTLSAAYARLER